MDQKPFVFGVVALLFLTGCNSLKILSLREEQVEGNSSSDDLVKKTDTVLIKNGTVWPRNITVGEGDRVKFINKEGPPQRIYSDPHPAHSDLPEFYSPPIYPGEVYEFVFTKTGFWGYHLEDNPSVSGQVIVR